MQPHCCANYDRAPVTFVARRRLRADRRYRSAAISTSSRASRSCALGHAHPAIAHGGRANRRAGSCTPATCIITSRPARSRANWCAASGLARRVLLQFGHRGKRGGDQARAQARISQRRTEADARSSPAADRFTDERSVRSRQRLTRISRRIRTAAGRFRVHAVQRCCRAG